MSFKTCLFNKIIFYLKLPNNSLCTLPCIERFLKLINCHPSITFSITLVCTLQLILNLLLCYRLFLYILKLTRQNQCPIYISTTQDKAAWDIFSTYHRVRTFSCNIYYFILKKYVGTSKKPGLKTSRNFQDQKFLKKFSTVIGLKMSFSPLLYRDLKNL